MNIVERIMCKEDQKKLINGLSEILEVNKSDIQTAVENSIPIIITNVYDHCNSKSYLEKLMNDIMNHSNVNIGFSKYDLEKIDLNQASILLDDIFVNNKELVINQISNLSNISVKKTTLLLQTVVTLAAALSAEEIKKTPDFDPQTLINKAYKMRTNPILSKVIKSYIKSNFGYGSNQVQGIVQDVFN